MPAGLTVPGVYVWPLLSLPIILLAAPDSVGRRSSLLSCHLPSPGSPSARHRHGGPEPQAYPLQRYGTTPAAASTWYLSPWM